MLRLLLRQIFFSNSCSLCGKTLNDEKYLCYNCRIKLQNMSELKNLDNVYYLYYYKDVKNIIFDLKFRNRKRISEDISEYIQRAIIEIIEKEKINYVISVPANKKRILERGYNQVDEVLNSSKIEYVKINRIKNTKKMYKIKDLKKRKENIKKAFVIEGNYEGKNILIVDDIITTGATINELRHEFLNVKKANNVVLFTITIVKKYFNINYRRI